MNDDFEDEDLDIDDSSFDDFEDNDKSLGGAIKDNPLVKIGLIIAAIIVVFFVISLFGGDDENVNTSVLRGVSPEATAPPGTEAASQEYIEAIQEVNERDVEIAQATGTSALPTPIEPPVGVLTVPEQEEETEDPLQRWRRLQEERLQRELQQAQTIEPAALPDDTARLEQVQQLADAMSAQMQAVLDSRSNQISYLAVKDASEFNEEQAENNAASGFLDDGELEEEIIQEVLLPAGEIEYAELLIEASTDAPGPVLAEIVSGPLKGGRLIGSFSSERDYLVLSFGTLTLNEETYDVNAVAIDPNTTLPGVATEVNQRYFSRVFLPAAAEFVTGFADALAENSTTDVTIVGETVVTETDDLDTDEAVAAGIEEAGQQIADFIEEEADSIRPLIRVAPGTPLGILFTESVVSQDEEI